VPTLGRNRPVDDVAFAASRGRPVLLATLDVAFDEEAAAFAVDAAVETGQKLIVANVVEMPLGPLCLNMGYGPLELEGAVQESIKAPAELAHQLGVEVERLRIRSPHPIGALLEIVAERQPGLLVFGPDRSQLRPRIFRKVAKRIRDQVACLVWLPG
jgi:nucleotide-binding universal stress UspA family protein